MKPITRIMIKKYKLMKLKYDFAGYIISNANQLSFHHLIISHKDCKKLGFGEGYWEFNGAILVQDTAHDYLHLIESRDEEIFSLITSEMIDENVKGRLDIANLRKIRDLLEYFEKQHCADRTNRGKLLIKEEYIRRRIKLWRNFMIALKD